MKSVYAKILLWCFATLLISLQVFSMVTRFVQDRTVGKGGPMARFDSFVLQEAVEAYESGGSGKLAAYLHKVAAITGPQRYLTDPAGIDRHSWRQSIRDGPRRCGLAAASSSPFPPSTIATGSLALLIRHLVYG